MNDSNLELNGHQRIMPVVFVVLTRQREKAAMMIIAHISEKMIHSALMSITLIANLPVRVFTVVAAFAFLCSVFFGCGNKAAANFAFSGFYLPQSLFFFTFFFQGILPKNGFQFQLTKFIINWN